LLLRPAPKELVDKEREMLSKKIELARACHQLKRVERDFPMRRVQGSVGKSSD
jgi:hypothetical protein